MSLIAADLVTDLDVLALDVRALSDFGTGNATLSDKRRVAVTDWLAPRLEQAGYQAYRHLARRTPDAAWGYTASAYTDRAGVLGDATIDDVNVNSLFITAGSDALYVGSRQPFRGLYVGMADAVNTTASVSSLSYWNGAWSAVTSVVDGTVLSAGKTLSGSGRITWSQPDDWFQRAVNNSPAYWARMQVSVRPSTGAAVGQVLPLARSRLTLPAALYTLHLLYAEGIAGTRGDWADKADRYEKKADTALTLALPLIGDEFDVDDTGAVDRVEVNSLPVTRWSDVFAFERG